MNNPLPFDHDSERSILGAIMRREGVIDDIRLSESSLDADDFHDMRYRAIYTAILSIYDEGGIPEFIAVSDELERQGNLKIAKGKATVADIADIDTPAMTMVWNWVKIVKEKSQRRKMIQFGQSIIDDCYNGTQDMPKIMDNAESAIFRISQQHSELRSYKQSEIVPEVMEEIAAYQRGDIAAKRMLTGFQGIDYYMQGMKNGSLIVLAGKSSHGKTQLASQIALNVAKEGKVVQFISIEMTKKEVSNRMACSLAKVEKHLVGERKIGEEEWDRLVKAQNELVQLPIHTVDPPTITISGIRGLARKDKIKEGTDLIIVDYLTAIDMGTKHENRSLAVGHCCHVLKAIAKELDVPVILLSQLNRSLDYRKDRKPRLSDLRDSGQIEQDADIVAFVYQAGQGNSDDAEADIIISKNRNGKCGTVKMMFAKGEWVRQSWRSDDEYRPDERKVKDIYNTL